MKNARGFTLIEVLIALFILAGGIVLVANAWSGNFMRMRKTVMYNDVATLLERKMLEIEAKYKDKQGEQVPEEDGGDFGPDYKQYRWTLKSKDLKFPDITPLLVAQSGGQGVDDTMLSMLKQVTEYLNKTVKELKVSVFAKSSSGKEVEFSAVQYLIDYTQDFSGLGGLGGGAPAGAGGTPPPPAPAAGGGTP
jgi:general secretion pathway protein I